MAEPVRFLLVDDRPENLDGLEALLRRDGLELLRAASGPEALELLLVHDFALALIDVQMPGMNGLELAELMRGTARTRHVPIIFLTAGGADEDRRFRGYEAGAVDFLEKPVDPHMLRHKAEVFFQLDRQRRDLLRQRDELEASEARFRAIVEAMPQIAFITQADGRVDFVSSRFREVTGLPPEAAFGDGWATALHPEDRDRCAEAWSAAVAAGTPYTIEQRLRTPDGGWRWFLTRAVPLRGPGGAVLRWFGTATDIAEIVAAREVKERQAEELERLVRERTHALLRAAEEQRRAEEASRQAEKLAALGQLTGGVAHDFNNLLQVVSSGAALLRRSGTREEQRDAVLDGMVAAVATARDLIARLLAFARRQPLAPETFDLAERLTRMSGLLAHTLGPRVRVEVDFAADLWPVHCDAAQLEVAILNLAVNARDAMPEGGTLTLEARNAALPAGSERPAGEHVCLAVRDTGEGMPPAVLARMFEPFFTTKEVGKGTGLGLPQVFGFAKQSGGEVRIESEQGRGTTVILHLPRAAAAPVALAAAAGAVADGSRAPTGRTVLVIEDNRQAGDFAAQLLEELGYRTLRAASGVEARRMLASGLEVDAVFSDVVMPGGLSGVELAAGLRETHPHVAVLLATGYSAGFAAVPKGVETLRKPYGLDDLAAGLRRASVAVAPARTEETIPG
jgi:PAS domain S-box-containing protein